MPSLRGEPLVATGCLDALAARGDAQAARLALLVGIVDALLLYRVGAVAAVDPTAVLTAYVAGLPRR